MRRARCAVCGATLAPWHLIEQPVAAAKLGGDPVGVLDAPDAAGNATRVVCRARLACERRQRKVAA